MSWQKIVLLVWFALILIANISFIGKRRRVITPADVVRVAILLGVWSWLVVVS